MARIDAKTGAPVQRTGVAANIMADLMAKRPKLATALARVPDQAGVYLFKDGNRNGVDAQLMKKSVAQLTDDDIVALAAYLSSLAP